jgi:hypothetical protein
MRDLTADHGGDNDTLSAARVGGIMMALANSAPGAQETRVTFSMAQQRDY